MDQLSKSISLGRALDLLEIEIEGQIQGVSKQVPCLAGKPGIGKTESIEHLAEKLGLVFIPVQLSATFPEEFSGIPDFLNAPESLAQEWSVIKSKSAKFTQWSIPELVTLINTQARLAKQQDTGVLVLLDDIHAIDLSVERFLFNLLREKRIGRYQLEDNVYVVAAMNDSTQAGFRGFNAAVLDRLAVYSVSFDFDYWYKVIGAKLHPLIAGFTKVYRNEFMLGEENTRKVTPSPRSWTELSEILKITETKRTLDYTAISVFANARVGIEATSELLKFYTIYNKFNFEKILTEKNTAVVGDDLTDQILFSLIIRYLKNEKHVDHLIDIIKVNVDKPQFISSLVIELATYLDYNKNLLRTKHFKKLYNFIIDPKQLPPEVQKYFKETLDYVFGLN